MRSVHGLCLCVALAMGAVGCAESAESGPRELGLGQVELRLSASPTIFDVSRIVIESDGATMFEIPRQPDGTFNGTILLATGTHSLVARGYAQDILVGESQAITVAIQAGAVTRAGLRLLDVSPEAPPLYGPIIAGVSYPPSIEAGTAGALAIAAIAPGGDPLIYAWSSDCSDATFSSPTATTTSWSKPTPGTCTITASVTSNQLTRSESFVIIVFPVGTSGGAALIDFDFGRRPNVFASLDAGCAASTEGGVDSSCTAQPASPAFVSMTVAVYDWGGSAPGELTLADDCGGTAVWTSRWPDGGYALWTPPTAGGLCYVTITASNGDGLTSHPSVAVLTRPGT